MYRMYKNILHSFHGDFKIFVKSDIFYKNFMAHFLDLQDDQGVWTFLVSTYHPQLPISVYPRLAEK